MKNLRRKEHDTSATICEEGGFTVRTKGRRLLLFDRQKNVFDLHCLTLIAGPPDRWE